MSDHLFGSITLPPDLRHLVDIHRFHLDRGAGGASLFDGWRAFLGHLRRTGPASLMATAVEHLEHFSAKADDAVGELLGSPANEVVSLGLAMHSLLAAEPPRHEYDASGQPGWLLDIESRQIVQASVRDEASHDGPTPWIVELDFGRTETSCLNVWINPDGSLYQLYPTDERMSEVEAFLSEIDHRVPDRRFLRVPPADALRALRTPGGHADTALGERTLLRWLARTRLAS